ncbi:hypothetical protein J2X16_003294 [Pelomonas aquatica]|uniref:HEAT repeat domain-containing protein n=1 Tax=Pelomonas aquatica TaxID=431058 RepID=A0ABU1ZD72_9BURK|nr:hypothetical protein [Pelomonas aquatica]MDR7297945.1 hypothetical protein [Pelomonas aquatica]
MKPGVQRLAWLAGIAGVGALAFAVTHWRAGSDAMPQQASVPAPSPPVASAPAVPLDEGRAVAAATAAASVPAMAMPASAALRRPPLDVSRMQPDIQLAISSDQRGKAGEAARHIQRCLALERDPERARQRTEDMLRRFPEPVASAMRASHQELVASCQAVDAASRAQLLPLLRRSLDEGDKGAAAGLVQALGKSFNLADEPGVLPALRRDAWDCDRSSQGVLSSLVRRDPQLLTPNEIGALRDQERIQLSKGLEAVLRKAEGDPKRQAAIEGMLATFKPPPEANAAEVARISADIQSRCESGPARAGGVRPAMPG